MLLHSGAVNSQKITLARLACLCFRVCIGGARPSPSNKNSDNDAPSRDGGSEGKDMDQESFVSVVDVDDDDDDDDDGHDDYNGDNDDDDNVVVIGTPLKLIEELIYCFPYAKSLA